MGVSEDVGECVGLCVVVCILFGTKCIVQQELVILIKDLSTGFAYLQHFIFFRTTWIPA